MTTEYLLALILFWVGGLNFEDQTLQQDASSNLGSILVYNGLGPNWPFGPGDPFGPGGPHGPGNPGPPPLPWPPVSDPFPEFPDFGTLPPLVLPPTVTPPNPWWQPDDTDLNFKPKSWLRPWKEFTIPFNFEWNY